MIEPNEQESNKPEGQENSGRCPITGRFKPGFSGNPKGGPKVSIIAEVRRQLRENPDLVQQLAASAIEQAKSNAQYAKELLARIDGPTLQRIEVSQLTPEQALEALRLQSEEDGEG